MGRGVIILLAVSLAANVFAGGFFVGRIVAEKPAVVDAKPPKSPERDHERRSMRRLLRGENDGFGNLAVAAPETRAVFRDVFIEAREEARLMQREVRAARSALREALAKEPWDRAAVGAAATDVAAAQQRQRDFYAEKLIDAFQSLTPEQRATLLQAQQEDFERRRRQRRQERQQERKRERGEPRR
ncbi:MAG: periplasmic heavy metal sensor [Pseudomonadota bacterium]